MNKINLSSPVKFAQKTVLLAAFLGFAASVQAVPTKIADTSADVTTQKMVLLPDVNADNVADFGLFYINSETSQPSLNVVSGMSLETIRTITWADIYDNPTVHVFPDMNSNDIADIGVFGVRKDENNVGKAQMFVKDLGSGARSVVYNWPANWTEVSPLILDDINGDDVVDVAIQGRFKDGNRPQLSVRDGATGGSLRTFSYPNLFTDPLFFQHSDYNQDGVPDIATFGRITRNNKIQIKIADGTDPSARFKAFNFPDKWDEIEWVRLDDSNGDGIDDWGLFGRNKDDGRPQLINKSGVDPRGALRIYAWPADLQDLEFLVVPDMNGDGVNDVAVGGVKNSGRLQIQVKDGVDRNSTLLNHNINLSLTNVSFHVLADMTLDGSAEIGFYGQNAEGEYELVVRNAEGPDGELVSYNFGGGWSEKPALSIFDNESLTSVGNILLIGANANQQSQMQIWGIGDKDQDGFGDSYDAFPDDENEWLDTDGDLTGNNADTDDDGDNVLDVDDAFPLDENESVDTDNDGTGNNADPDDDNDNIADEDDGFPLISIGGLTDTDNDGIPDDCDTDCQATGMVADDDDDGNGVLDEEELASLAISITTPQSLVTVGTSPVTVVGTVSPINAVIVLNGVEITNNNGTFSGDVALTEGSNTIEARASISAGVQTDTISVSLDKTPPFLTIDSHTDNQIVYVDTITVTGLVNDIVRGTVEASQANVSVNGNDALIQNRSYSAEDIELQVGENIITVAGADQVGNTSTKTITLTYEVPIGKRIVQISGENQSAVINSELINPLVVKVIDGNDDPLENETVVFRVSQGSGAVGVGSENEGRAFVVETDADGIASTSFKVGARTGTNNHKATAAVVGVNTQIAFNASATGEIGNKLSVNSGNNQRGAVGKVLPEAFVVVVTDNGANVVPNARVIFNATVGGGSFSGETSIQVSTDSDGRASVEYTLGQTTGIDRQRILATLIDAPDGQAITAGFSATAFVPADPGQTTVTGVVLDNQDMAIPNVTIRIEGTTREALSAADGRFEITEAPVGPIHLIADGSTATVEGEFPSLGYDMVTISGVDNPLPAPIYMVKLDTDNAVLAGSQDVALELDQFPGFKLEIAKDSVTFPDGSKEGLISVTPVNAGTVPMAPPNGMQPQFIVTIQPTGTLFDPPAKLTLPNVDAHEAGAQVEMYSFDHDLEEFVAIGLGTVSEDGTLVESNPGVGVVKAGWHCGSQPGGQSCAHNCPVCQDCDGDCNCVPADGDPRLAGLDVIGDCKEPGCENGAQVTVNDDADIPDDDEIGDCKNFNCVNGSVVVEDDPLDETKCTTCGANGPEPKPDGTVPDDDKCIICKDGKETKKPDNEIGSTTIAFNGVKNFIADVNTVLEWVGSTKKIPEISLELQNAKKEVCCTEQNGATTLEETDTGTVVFPVFGVSWTPTIPPWSGDYTFRVFGRSIGVAYGIRFTAGFSGKVSLSRTKRECQGDNCWGGSATGDLGLSGGPFGSVPNPASSPVACGSLNEKRPCDLIRLEGTIKTGVNIQAGVNCEKITGTIGHNGVSINADVILAEGSWVEVGASASWVIVNSGSLAVIDIALPN